MGIVFRQSIKNTAVIFAGAVLGALFAFISSALIPKQELGFTRLLTSQTMIATFILLFGANNTLLIFIHRYDNADKKKGVFMTFCFLLPALLFLLSLLPYFYFSEYLFRFYQPQDIPFMRKYFMCLPVYTLFYMYSLLLEHYLISNFKVALSSFVKEVVLKFLNLLLILLYGYGFINFHVFIYAFIFSNLLTLLLLLYYASREESFRFSSDWKQFSRQEYKELFKFTWYHALMSTSIFLMGFLDLLMLAPLDKEGLKVVPVYANAVFIVSVVTIPYRALSAAAVNDLNKSYAAGEHVKVKDIFKRSGLNILITSIFMALIIGCNMHNAVAVIGKGYADMLPLVLILMIGRLADSATGLNDQALSMSQHYKINFYLSIILVVFLVIAYKILIPQYSVFGAAWATSGAYLVFNVIKLYFVWKKVGLQPFSKGSATTLLIGAITLGIVVFIPAMSNPYLDTIIRSGAILIIYAALLIWMKPSKDLQEFISHFRKERRLY